MIFRKSGKSRRKTERKRHSGKKGSVYEEEYLINSSRTLIEQVISMKLDVRNLINALVLLEYFSTAQEVQSAYADLIEWIRPECKVIFAQPEVVCYIYLLQLNYEYHVQNDLTYFYFT
jgi:elongator complex protein 1